MTMLERTVDARDVREWFDETYRRQGLSYLRPTEAYRVLVNILEPRPSERLLDVGCGPGHLLREAAAYHLVLAGVDLSPVAVELGMKLVPEADIREADATKLPFPDQSFDYVTCIGTLERIPDPERAILEQIRVAKPSARFCFLVRNADTLTWRILMEGLKLRNAVGHQGASGKDDWCRLFERCGLTVERILPDQWPLMWRERAMRRLGLSPSFTRLRRGLRPLRFAGEFIFLLRHG
ncbi:MAG: class I SAM-dependent methyltransferase [Acidobacteria bacterium]|nr:MAG: class I SAM-dependent methyltransferase [Acidobacteriota bacterium]